MTVTKGLDRIQSGDASAKEAHSLLREALASDVIGSASIYAALRSWTWKALLGRRFDEEMEAWFRVLRNTSAQLHRRDDKAGFYVEALMHLVDESLRYGAANRRELLMGRSHMGELLDLVRQQNGRAERSLIESRMGLKTSRLSQILTEMTVAGALNRELDGKHATFVLTDEGRALLETWVPVKRSPPPALPAAATLEREAKKEIYPHRLFPEQAREDGGEAGRLRETVLEVSQLTDPDLGPGNVLPGKVVFGVRPHRMVIMTDDVANQDLPDWTGSYDTADRILEEPLHA